MIPGAPLPTLLVPLFASYHGWLGGVHYVQNMLKTLDALPENRRPTVYVFDDTPGDWPCSVEAACALPLVKAVIGPRGVVVRNTDDAAGRFPLSIDPMDRRRTIARSVDGIVPMPMAEAHMVTTARHWAWIPDFQHKRLPGLFDDADRKARDALCRIMADRDGPLLLSSADALRDFREFFPTHRVRPYVWSFVSTISATESAPIRAVVERYGLPPRFLYVPNQFWVHKDHRTAFDAMRRLRDRGLGVVLACTGGTNDYRCGEHFKVLFRSVEEQGLGDLIRYLGVVPQAEQIALLRACTAVVQPSLFEGWSTVVEDARAIGCPLIVSDIAVHREQLGKDGGIFFRSGDAEDLAEVIARVLPGLPPERDAAVERAARDASLVRRRACAEAFLDCLARERSRGRHVSP